MPVEHPCAGSLVVVVEDQIHGEGAELGFRLCDRGQARVRVGSKGDVVDPDHGKILGNSPAGRVCRPQGCHSRQVVVGNDAERRTLTAEVLDDGKLPRLEHRILGRYDSLRPKCGGFERATVAKKAEQARSHIWPANVGEFAMAKLKQVLSRQDRCTQVVELDLPNGFLHGVGTESLDITSVPGRVVEDSGRYLGVPVDNADMEPVINRLTGGCEAVALERRI